MHWHHVSSLLEQAKAGDIGAFTRLFEPLRGNVFAVACRFVGAQDAEDVVMDTYLKAWKALPGFRGGSSLKTWLAHIARNACLDRIRRVKADRADSMSAGDPEAPARELADPTVSTPDETVRSREMAGVVHEALARLDETHRTALLLRFVDDLSYAEIAAATGVHIGTVMSRLFNGKRKLRAIVDSMEQGRPGETAS